MYPPIESKTVGIILRDYKFKLGQEIRDVIEAKPRQRVFIKIYPKTNTIVKLP